MFLVFVFYQAHFFFLCPTCAQAYENHKRTGVDQSLNAYLHYRVVY